MVESSRKETWRDASGYIMTRTLIVVDAGNCDRDRARARYSRGSRAIRDGKERGKQ